MMNKTKDKGASSSSQKLEARQRLESRAKHLVLDASCINSLYLPLGFIANLPSTLNVNLAVEVKNTIFHVFTDVVEEEISEFILINHHPLLQDDILQGINMWPSFRFNSR
ncbi:hypothetical protein IV203_016387 [Nitzschia inconspicua]|uniref:Uncharacterized protein n=1 Tax=Nitzschia inconspicua TaxID=303405 RepID=A0A9K3PHB8_9STRA|nr:hypothetical protein IV203_016387 [Nitzschia inconspicua]